MFILHEKHTTIYVVLFLGAIVEDASVTTSPFYVVLFLWTITEDASVMTCTYKTFLMSWGLEEQDLSPLHFTWSLILLHCHPGSGGILLGCYNWLKIANIGVKIVPVDNSRLVPMTYKSFKVNPYLWWFFWKIGAKWARCLVLCKIPSSPDKKYWYWISILLENKNEYLGMWSPIQHWS